MLAHSLQVVHLVARLEEAVAGTGQHGLRLLQAFNLVGARFTALFEGGDDEVALLVQVGDVGRVFRQRGRRSARACAWSR